MKYLLALLILLPVTAMTNAQEDAMVHRHRIPEPVKIIALYAGSIMLNAAGDGLNNSEHKAIGHICNAASIGLLLTSPFIINYDKSRFAWYIVTYVSFRIALFDYTYNLARGIPLDHVGTSNYWDQMLGKMTGSGIHIGRAGALVVGVTIPLNRFGGRNRL